MRDMAKRMKDKYYKYWDNEENTNFLLYVAVVLDPRYIMSYIEFCFGKIYRRGSYKNSIMCDKVLKTFQELFDYYLNLSLKGQGDSTSKIQINQSDDSWNDIFEKYMDDRDQGGMGKIKLDVCLVDARERKGEVFDILEYFLRLLGMYWECLFLRSPHKLLFSTSGRTIDAYRSSLSPKTAEALICSQDWLRSSEIINDLRGEPEHYLQLEKLENGEFGFNLLYYTSLLFCA